MATLAQIGLKLNEDPCLPLETSQRTLQIAQEHIALMHDLIAKLDPDSYLYTYTETLIIGQRAIISYITKQMQEEIDTPKQQDIANE